MSTEAHISKPTKLRMWLFILAAITILVAVILVVFSTDDTIDVTRDDSPPPAPLVSTLAVSPDVATAQISVYSELYPRWRTEIRAAVAGRITQVHTAALAGTRVDKGTPLIDIERTQYESAVSRAKTALAEAELAMLKADNDAKVARRQFDRDGVTAPNDLALKLPELRIAKSAVASAQAELRAAERHLEDTTVKAPFSGYVVQRIASLGQTVGQGEKLLVLSDDQHFELSAEVSQKDWALMTQPVAGAQANLYHRDGRQMGRARIRQGGGFLDPKTRQVKVFLEVTEAIPALLAGDFVRVEFAGRDIPDTLTLPESALTRAGYVWFVDADDLLRRHPPEILFRSDGALTIASPDLPAPMRVAKTPLASFLPGQRVTPQMVEQ